MKRLINCLGLFFFLLVSINTVSAQCGSFFKTNYRAVNKIYRVNNGEFLLDDWTGDGKSDFWNFQPNGSSANIIIYPSRPTGYWNWDNPIILTTTFPSSASTLNVRPVVKDFNGDGRADLLVSLAGIMVIHQNNGSGALVGQTAFFNPPEFQDSFGYYDLNSDGFLDWINMVSTQTSQGSSVGYQLGQANGTFGARVNIFTGTVVAGSTKAVGDFNGDGKIDVAFSSNGSGNGFVYRVARNIDGVNFEVGNPALYGPSFDTRFQIVRDFNNDGRMDILATAYDTFSNPPVRKLLILYGQSNNSFSTTEYPLSDSSAAQFVAAELTGDNQLDIIEVGSNFYSVHKNNGGGSFTRTDYQRHLAGGKFEDFSGDGKADLYYSNSAFQTRNIFDEDVVIVKENTCQPFGETRRANFEIDGVGDLVTWNPANGNWRSFSPSLGFSNNNGTSRLFNWGSGALGDIPAPGDFDGDGLTDYTVYRSSTGEWWSFLSSNGAWSVFRFGVPGDVPVPQDYDGGGKTDIAVFRPSEGNWYIWYSETQQFGAAHFGLNGDKPVQADYDGDGKTDLAVFRPSTGIWYYLRSSDLGFGAVNWGLSTDKPVPADYDGDGKADIAVFRDGDWYILRSLSGGFNFIHWGTTGDIPMPLYQNGEFAEMVVYRPNNTTWYSFRSPSSAVIFGQPPSAPVYFGLPNN